MTLQALREAAEARRTAEHAYRSAVLASVAEHGVTVTARTLGVSAQAVRQLVNRARRDEGPERLAELDTRYQAVVVHFAGGHVLKDGAGITALRNGQARRRAKRGLKALPSLKAEAMSHAESQVLELLRAGLAVEAGPLRFTPADLQTIETLQAKEAPSDVPF